jgi:hypothetical protein
MECQRCALPIEHFSEVMMDGTLLFHKQCYKEGIAELQRTQERTARDESSPDSSAPPSEPPP